MKRTPPPSRPSIWKWLEINQPRNQATRPMSSRPASKGSSENPEESNFLNSIFAIHHRAANIRLITILVLLLIIWGVLVVVEQSCPKCDAILYDIQNPALLMVDRIQFLLLLGWETIKLFFAPRILHQIFALIFPFWFAIRIAGLYLDDIFELRDSRLANRFITRAAFAYPDYELVQIEDGNFAKGNQKSTAFRIGGPAYARVHLENAAIFEHSDGEVVVVGPTVNLPGHAYFMPGFTRMRQAVDLRPQTIPLEKVSGRTKDGIPIQLQNIRLLYSIQRGPAAPTLRQPYPFTEQALKALVYRQAVGGNSSSVISIAVKGLVSGELVQFISQFTLGELLSTIGEPEVLRQIEMDKLVQREIMRRRRSLDRRQLKIILLPWIKPRARKRNLKAIRRVIMEPRTPPPPPAYYVPRTRLSDRFYREFATEFPRKADQRGIRLEWIDVGTWNHNLDMLSSQNQEALRLTNENATRGHPRVLDELRARGLMEQLAVLNERYPILAFVSYRQQSQPEAIIVRSLLKDYLGILQSVTENLEKTGRQVPRGIRNSMAIIDRALRTEHVHFLQPEDKL